MPLPMGNADRNLKQQRGEPVPEQEKTELEKEIEHYSSFSAGCGLLMLIGVIIGIVADNLPVILFSCAIGMLFLAVKWKSGPAKFSTITFVVAGFGALGMSYFSERNPAAFGICCFIEVGALIVFLIGIICFVLSCFSSNK